MRGVSPRPGSEGKLPSIVPFLPPHFMSLASLARGFDPPTSPPAKHRGHAFESRPNALSSSSPSSEPELIIGMQAHRARAKVHVSITPITCIIACARGTPSSFLYPPPARARPPSSQRRPFCTPIVHHQQLPREWLSTTRHAGRRIRILYSPRAPRSKNPHPPLERSRSAAASL